MKGINELSDKENRKYLAGKCQSLPLAAGERLAAPRNANVSVLHLQKPQIIH